MWQVLFDSLALHPSFKFLPRVGLGWTKLSSVPLLKETDTQRDIERYRERAKKRERERKRYIEREADTNIRLQVLKHIVAILRDILWTAPRTEDLETVP